MWLCDRFSTGCLFFLKPATQLIGGDVLPVSPKPGYGEDSAIPKGARVKCTHGPARLQTLYQRVLVNCQPPLFDSGSIRSRPRDAKPYTNPYQASNTLRTVAHDPLARLPTTATATSIASKSTLKPEAAVYIPRSIGDDGILHNVSTEYGYLYGHYY